MTLDHKIKQQADVVFNYMTDMKKFVSMHPIIFKMDDLGNGNYKVYEKLKLLGIPTTFTYSATVTGDPQNKTVNIKAVVMKMTHIEMNFTIKQEGDQSHIHETVTFKSPLPIKGIMKTSSRPNTSNCF
jgi:hypothetical protein